MDVLGMPEMPGRLAEGPRPEEHRVGAGTQKAHDEAVRLVAAADEVPRFLLRPERDDAVDRRDEVGVDASFAQPEAAAVAVAHRRGKIECGQSFALEEKLQRRAGHGSWRSTAANSATERVSPLR